MPTSELDEATKGVVNRIYRNLEVLKALPYGCCIKSMRVLLGEPGWAPDEIVDIIVANKGFPSESMGLLENHAPVEVIQDGQISLDGNERVVISYQVDAEAGIAHMECVNVCDIDKECLALIRKRD